MDQERRKPKHRKPLHAKETPLDHSPRGLVMRSGPGRHVKPAEVRRPVPPQGTAPARERDPED